MELDPDQARLTGDGDGVGGRFVPEHPHRGHPVRDVGEEVPDLFRRDLPGAAGQDEADGVRAGAGRDADRIRGAQAAHFDKHSGSFWALPASDVSKAGPPPPTLRRHGRAQSPAGVAGGVGASAVPGNGPIG